MFREKVYNRAAKGSTCLTVNVLPNDRYIIVFILGSCTNASEYLIGILQLVKEGEKAHTVNYSKTIKHALTRGKQQASVLWSPLGYLEVQESAVSPLDHVCTFKKNNFFGLCYIKKIYYQFVCYHLNIRRHKRTHLTAQFSFMK